MQITAHDSTAVLQRLAKSERDGRVRIRLQAVVLGVRGRTSREIAEALGVSARTARSWVERYNRGGREALKEQPGRGRPSRLSASQEVWLCKRLDSGAQANDGVCSLRGRDIVRILKEKFGVVYTVGGVYRLLHRLGYSSLMPRPQHRKADVERQQAFKKTVAQPLPKRLPRRIRTGWRVSV